MSKQDNRQKMPTVAQIVDEFRPFLGKVIYASENGHTYGKQEPVDETRTFTIPPNYAPMRQVKP